MKNKILLLVFLAFFSFSHVHAQQVSSPELKVDYGNQPPVDMDLDGLTDQAEVQIYATDPKNADTDGDGYYDGVEIMSGSDPLDVKSFPGMPSAQDFQVSVASETPWAWYIARVGGLVGFVLLYLSIFLGLTIRVPLLRKFFAPLYAMQAHCWIAFQATLFALIHGLSLMFDKFINFRFIDVFVPLASQYKPGLVGIGIVGFYLMVILTVSSYARKYISQKLWRALHFLNIFLYVFVVFHAYNLGTDMKNPIVGYTFIGANVLLVLMMFFNMFSRIFEKIKRKRVQEMLNEDIDLVK